MNDLNAEGLLVAALAVGGTYLIFGRVGAGIVAIFMALLVAYARARRHRGSGG